MRQLTEVLRLVFYAAAPKNSFLTCSKSTFTEKHIFSRVFRCYLEHSDKQFADQLATRLLSELQRQPDYHKRQALGFCLDRLLDKCSPAARTKIIRTFLDS